MILRNFLLLFFLYFTSAARSQNEATLREYKKWFTTYPFSDPNPIPSANVIYPYFRYDGFTNKPIQKQWKVVELENDFIKLMILPEIGGKIWSAIEKSTGKPFIYYNHTVKFRDVAMRGPWTSGGIEANYGIIGHTPNCATPVDYLTRKNDDGSVSCIIGVLDLLTNSNWTIEINLPKDKAYFTTKSVWHNNSNLEEPYYHWMNTGLPATGNLEFIYRGNHYLGHEGEYSDWPINKQNGKNISFYESNNFGGYKSYHVFGSYTNFFGAYWHDNNFGIARYAPHDEKAGKKIWIWGLSQQGMIWGNLLTDTDGQYVEVQSGRLFNQSAEGSTFTPFKHESFAPYETDTWKEYWYPVLKTRGFVEANEYGALNVLYENGYLKLYFNPVQRVNELLQLKEDDKIIYNKKIEALPLQTFIDSVKGDFDINNLLITLGVNKLIYNTKQGTYDLKRPLDSPVDFDWNSAYGLFVQGKELCDERMYDAAEIKLKLAIDKDHNFLPALVKMSELTYRNMRYSEALDFAKKSLSINTNDGCANYYYGLINEKLGNTLDAMDGFDLATLSGEFRSTAYTCLSRMYLKQKDYDKAVEYADKATDFNRYNIAALESKAIACRYENKKQEAAHVLDDILLIDPLNHFASFENYMWDSTQKNKLSFISGITNEQPAQTFLELVIGYYNRGCLDESEKILAIAPPNDLIEYWQAFLKSKQKKSFSSTLDNANNSSAGFIFPFRQEDEEVFTWAHQHSNDWKPKYYLALLYKSRNRLRESRQLFMECANEPQFAPFYAARAAIFLGIKDEQALSDFKKAIALDVEEWRYRKLLCEYYMNQGENEEALQLIEPFYKTHKENYGIGMVYAKTLLLNKRYRECSQLLSVINILPFEGATSGRDLYHEATLMQAIEAMKNGKNDKALSFIKNAKSWPLNLGVGKPYPDDIDERLEDWMTYLCLQKLGRVVDAKQYLKAVIAFTPKIENTVSNFLPANDLITAWTLEKTNSRQTATDWLNAQVLKYPANKMIKWCNDVFLTGSFDMKNINNPEARIIERLAAIR